MDGWGLSEPSDSNAVSSAHTPHYDRLMQHYPNATLQASGPAVGLPEGQPGNSEVGHMNIGAGRIVKQDLPRIHDAIADNSLADLPELQAFCQQLLQTGGRAHLFALFSRGGVHAHLAHQAAIANILTKQGIDVIIHAITDGRDTLPKTALAEYDAFDAMLDAPVQFGTVIGRYFAMDRDKRWERTNAAFAAIAQASADHHEADFAAAIKAGYDKGQSDEFIEATIIAGYQGIQSGDGVFIGNFRVDRARQILSCFQNDPEAQADHITCPKDLGFLSMTPVFSDDRAVSYLFGPQDLSQGLGEIVSDAGLSQMRLAETEKYPHVTYFFNGGDESHFGGEARTVIPSPKVATYDLQPEMSAQKVLAQALQSIDDKAHDLLIINFANPDMVGHTGDIQAARKAVETVDSCIGQLSDAVIAAGGAMLITADHGNCEVMWDHDADSPHTAHTTNLVPIILISDEKDLPLSSGILADLAPTLLALLGLSQPAAMTGKNLLNA